jgi:hypothetical protein
VDKLLSNVELGHYDSGNASTAFRFMSGPNSLPTSVASAQAEAQKMERYDKGRACRKCGSKDIYDRFHAAWTSTTFHCDCFGYFGDKPIPPDREREHIARHCRVCHYEWREAPLDAA